MDALMQLPLDCVQSDLAVNLGASGEESTVIGEKLELNCGLQTACSTLKGVARARTDTSVFLSTILP